MLSMFVGAFLFNFSNISAYAAEIGTTNPVIEDNTEEITINNKQDIVTENIVADSTVTDSIVTETEDIASDLKQDETEEAIISAPEQEENTDEVGNVSEQEELSEEASVEEKETDQDKNKETDQNDKEDVKKYTKAQLRLLSALIYCESQGESYTGKLAVGIVVMNRVRSGQFPDTLKGVIYQKYQFSPAGNGSLENALSDYDKGDFTSKSKKECIEAAKAALSGTKSITVNGKEKNFSKYLFFSGWLRGHTFEFGNHEFK